MSTTNTQPMAVRLAAAIRTHEHHPQFALMEKASAELVRLHEVNTELLEALKLMESVQVQIDELPMFPSSHATESIRFKLFDARTSARAAIAKATGGAA